MNKNHLSAVIAVIVSTCAQAASFWIRPDKSDWNDVVNLKTGRDERTEDGFLPLDLTAGETCRFTLERRRR